MPAIRDKLETLKRVGLGYIKLGQQATTLSGGEAQRVKLSKELSRRATGKTLYILDEPTTGLHFEDTRKLLEVLHELVDQGNTVVVIEHNLDVMKTADWILDFGPEGGDGGGQIVAAGRPEDVAREPASWTGRYLAELLDRHEQRRKEAREEDGRACLPQPGPAAACGGGGPPPAEEPAVVEGAGWSSKQTHDSASAANRPTEAPGQTVPAPAACAGRWPAGSPALEGAPPRPRAQVPPPAPDRPFVLDFYCAEIRTAVEIDGSSHTYGTPRPMTPAVTAGSAPKASGCCASRRTCAQRRRRGGRDDPGGVRLSGGRACVHGLACRLGAPPPPRPLFGGRRSPSPHAASRLGEDRSPRSWRCNISSSN